MDACTSGSEKHEGDKVLQAPEPAVHGKDHDKGRYFPPAHGKDQSRAAEISTLQPVEDPRKYLPALVRRKLQPMVSPACSRFILQNREGGNSHWNRQQVCGERTGREKLLWTEPNLSFPIFPPPLKAGGSRFRNEGLRLSLGKGGELQRGRFSL